MNSWRSIARMLFGSGPKHVPVADLRAMMIEARNLINSEEYAKARGILLKAVGFRDDIIDAATTDWILGALEATWLFQNQFEEQIAFFTGYLNKYPGDVAAHRARAAALWYSDRLPDAFNDYSRALELNPADILSRSGRGQVLAELGESARAMRELDVALRILETTVRPDDSWVQWCKGVEAFARRGRGVAFAGLGQIKEAMSEFAESIALSPENAWVYYSRGRTHDHQGDHQGALSDYKAAMTKTKPSLSPIQKERARARIADLLEGPAPEQQG